VDRDAHQLARTLMRVAVVGAGWAGLAAAVQAVERGHQVTLFEMAGQPGGRARRVDVEGLALDNGQHILIGAYQATLGLMARVGVPWQTLLQRLPLTLVDPAGRGLRLPPGPPLLAFVRAVLGHGGWSRRERGALLLAAGGWAARRFRCDPAWTVAHLVRRLPPRVRRELIEPLCVAALNTPAGQASAVVFLRVLRDALFGGAGSADLLLPRRSLGELLPEPALRWLAHAGAQVRLGRRVETLSALPGGEWTLANAVFDAVLLACTAGEAARLTQPLAADWSARAAAFSYEPIVTVYLRSAGTRLLQPMTALRAGPDAPAQFVFDHGALGGADGVFAFVVSGASDWVARGLEATTAATLRQAESAFPAGTWREAPRALRSFADRRATFLCTPGLDRPPQTIAARLLACGDYVQGPYPATLEGAVRSGIAAVDALG
jgi:squalene-associated FAD-dependent desaturase